MTTSVDEVCNQILNDPKPLVFIDTCTILDVIRVLNRGSISDKNTSHALNLIQRSAKGDVWLITDENVPIEYSDNVERVVSEVKREIEKIHSSVQSLIQFQNLTSAPNVMTLATDFTALKLQEVARDIADNFLASCISIQRKDKYVLNAAARVRGYIAPAQRGKAEYKDCEITECFLDMASQLRGQGYTDKIIFVTANTKDYGGVGKLHPPLDNEFLSLGAEYSNTLEHVLFLAGLS